MELVGRRAEFRCHDSLRNALQEEAVRDEEVQVRDGERLSKDVVSGKFCL